MLVRSGCLEEIGRATGLNGGNGMPPSRLPVSIASSSRGSSLGVGGRELSMVDVELIESLAPRVMSGARVGLPWSLSPRLPPSGRPVMLLCVGV